MTSPGIEYEDLQRLLANPGEATGHRSDGSVGGLLVPTGSAATMSPAEVVTDEDAQAALSATFVASEDGETFTWNGEEVSLGGGGGGGGAVDSVNGKTGVVVLDYEDVGAASAAQGARADAALPADRLVVIPAGDPVPPGTPAGAVIVSHVVP